MLCQYDPRGVSQSHPQKSTQKGPNIFYYSLLTILDLDMYSLNHNLEKPELPLVVHMGISLKER
jgi:hypothetical protein